MGKKITDYPNNVSTTPDDASYFDLSEKIGVGSHESRKWTLTAFKTWVNSWVTASAVAWSNVTGKPTTISGYGITDAVDTTGGTANYVAKFTDSNTVEESQIQDDGTNIAVNTAIDTLYKYKVYTTAEDYAVGGYNGKLNGCGVVGYSNGTGIQTGTAGISNNTGATINIGVTGTALGGTTSIGLKGYASGSGTKYGIQLQDGTETVSGRFLKNMTTDGKGNWVSLASSDITTALGYTPLDKAVVPYDLPFACSDETTALTVGTGKVTVRVPRAMTITNIRASLTTAQTSGSIFTIDINQNGTSILGTKITIDNTEKTTTTATTGGTIVTSSLTEDAEITVDIDQIGDGTAKGLKVCIFGYITL